MTKMERGVSARDCVKILLACGLFQIAVYYFSGSMASGGRHVAVPQFDTLLYCQSARQIAQGTPYVFTPGDRPSTGCTSHLYPFLLAVPYKLGAQGDALITAGFALNAGFYLVFLLCWGIAISRLAGSPAARLTACLLTALNGHAASGAMAQSDMGLFMAVSAALVAALLCGRSGWTGVLLVVAPWCRPEGAILSFVLLAVLVGRRLVMRERSAAWLWVGAVLGICSALSVFAFNAWLTGCAQYQSVYAKGHFRYFSFLPALGLTVQDMLQMVRELLLGEPVSMPRIVFFVPLLGALAGWSGVFTRLWRRETAWVEVWWAAAALSGMMVVASSGWQNTNMDRYLLWGLPLWALYMGEGVVWCGERFGGSWKSLPAVVLLGLQASGAVHLGAMFYATSQVAQMTYDFGKSAHAALPPAATLGGESASEVYGMPGRRLVHLPGIYSPDFLSREPLTYVERLKHHPEWRFNYWLLGEDRAVVVGADVTALCAPAVVIGVNGTSVRPARWEALDRARVAPDRVAGDGWVQVDRVDVGNLEDESRCSYASYSRFSGSRFMPFAGVWRLGSNDVYEVGRMTLGNDSMTLNVRSGEPVRVVARLLPQVETEVILGAYSARRHYAFDSPLKMAARVDDRAAGLFSLAVSTNVTEVTDVAFTIPADAIRTSSPRLTLCGDHAALGYWFYQPAR